MGIACHMNKTHLGHVDLDRVNKAIKRSIELKRDLADVFTDSLRTQLAVVGTLCRMARREDGNERSHHVEQAEKGLDRVLELARKVSPEKHDRDEINKVRRNLLSLGATSGRATQ